jgi:hypothetical protein
MIVDVKRRKLMLNKKVLLAVLLLAATPSFAIISAEEAHNNADSVNMDEYRKQLPALLDLINIAIQEDSAKGEYATNVMVGGYDRKVIAKASDLLAEKGYKEIVYTTQYLREGPVLHIEW